jgi:formate-dependent nitrite reductase cytochrome c552 subunit
MFVFLGETYFKCMYKLAYGRLRDVHTHTHTHARTHARTHASKEPSSQPSPAPCWPEHSGVCNLKPAA